MAYTVTVGTRMPPNATMTAVTAGAPPGVVVGGQAGGVPCGLVATTSTDPRLPGRAGRQRGRRDDHDAGRGRCARLRSHDQQRSRHCWWRRSLARSVRLPPGDSGQRGRLSRRQVRRGIFNDEVPMSSASPAGGIEGWRSHGKRRRSWRIRSGAQFPLSTRRSLRARPLPQCSLPCGCGTVGSSRRQGQRP